MRYLSKETIYEKISREDGKSLNVVRAAVDFQFIFVAEKIRGGEFDKGIRLPYFGRFKINRRYLKFMETHRMSVSELKTFRKTIEIQSGRQVKLQKEKILRLIDTAISLYNERGNEDAQANKANLVRKNGKST